MTDQPMSMRDSAIAMHEAYTSFLQAGFSHGDALYLTACVLCGGPKPPPGAEEGGGQ